MMEEGEREGDSRGRRCGGRLWWREDEEDRDRAEDEEVEDETGRVLCVLQRGVETDSDGQEVLPDDWRTTADVIRDTGKTWRNIW